MCTSLTLKTKDGHNIFGRTMDFAIQFNESVNIIPRNFVWSTEVDKKERKSKYATIGMAVVINNHPVLADGMNEKGLICATLYFPGFSQFEEKTVNNKENVPSYDFVFWVLSQFENLNQVKKALKNMSIVNKTLSILNFAPPLHWILTDRSGKSIVVEKTSRGLEIFDNPVGVMTNSPNFQWHLSNLRQYIGLRPKQFENAMWGDLELAAFSQGSGTFGLPGDFTPPSRFVRAAYLKNNIADTDNEIKGINGVFHILSNCEVPKGVVLKSDDLSDYTFYTSAMCSESGNYYYHTYENRQISVINLYNEDLDSNDIKEFPNIKKEFLNKIN
ncbi:choloylglycine hydrolase [Clostridium rectalis]|uniref:choloylglycine hydrolase n=1 Tax=Clostridium rectalis TaxID=2040295 RepID=UPI000F631100|nr:choloylglycine hydrolase [Clostridium rectalis]